MDKQPLVSVLISVYNDQHYIGRAIDSILQQTFRDFEIIIIDDGSTDGTSSIIKEFQERNNSIKAYHQQNQGTASALNYGIGKCSGKYIARLDSDDFSYPHRLAEEVDFLEKNPRIGLVGGGCHIADNKGRIIGSRNIKTKNPYKTLLNRCIYQQSDVMFRKDVVEKLPGELVYRPKFKAEDYDLWLRISEIAGIAKLNTIYGVWTLNGGGYTLSRKEEQLEAVKELKKMAIARRSGKPDWYNDYKPVQKEKVHRTAIKDYEYDLIVAQVLLKSGRPKEARNHLKKYRNDPIAWAVVKKWHMLSYVPGMIMKACFDLREYILNNYSMEWR